MCDVDECLDVLLRWQGRGQGAVWAEGVKIMTEKEQEASEKELKKRKRTEEPLPFCTTAASAEHARASSEDEPCDDTRGQQEDQESEEGQ